MFLGSERREVKAKGPTLRDLIDALNDVTMGKLEKEVLVAGGSLDPKLKIFVNGNASDSLSTTLTSGDEVLLFSVIDGG
jgi:molybdopterin converting factor small subunit